MIRKPSSDFLLYKMNRVRCYICNIDINNMHYLRHFWSKKHLKNMPDCSREDIENKLYIVLSLRQLAREHDKSFQ